MEMCYDGALVMPNNYAVVDEEEMTYVDGGYWTNWSMDKSDALRFCRQKAERWWTLWGMCIATGAAVGVLVGLVGAEVTGGLSIPLCAALLAAGATGIANTVCAPFANAWGNAANAIERSGNRHVVIEYTRNALAVEINVR